ncbi:class I SAM-dependent methyltransferase [Kutzneria viridogrisea]|uniref:Methyltransferase type 12 n=2 Tax=Kutzneria TaxID=43356 RepID=W5W5X2_9PSEU|nr:class I SAM-dependent methyltransferase [Kutzneria albida]AHH96307.1 hypothetical protein KALB_2939 [Kutzneria albida DSM 43870]MBA8928478.1 SAM-dependent methyltransferase [Kutzneria viridogrisea]
MTEQDLRTKEIAAKRPSYLADLAQGTDRFFEPRADMCPWCGSTLLRVRLRTTDLIQHKPGRFVLEQCRDCRHVFQNPRLTPAGLEFYYRDCYDGLGEQGMSSTFEGRAGSYRKRADMVAALTEPKRWLDVGTGHGHFCRDAAQALPGTEFDGLDLSEGVHLAREQGWIDTAHQGEFVALAPELAGRYDVISMYHYLEHTTDPKAELAAAAEALPGGGYLAIELPDPECRWNRVLGRWWLPWLQPQHLNLMPIGNLRAALSEAGFTVVAEQRAQAHEAIDARVAGVLLVNALTIEGEDMPWRARKPSQAKAVLRKLAFLAALPMLVLGVLADKLGNALGPRPGWSNAYRVVARKSL